jgi:predicted regulator of amino acid metabolism with ACT domain
MVERDDDNDAAAAFYDKRRKWIDHLCERHDVKHATFRVGYWMAMRMNGKDQAMWWPIDRIAGHLGVDRKTVYSAIAELEGLRLMIVMRTMGKPSRYLIRLPYE